MSGHALRQKFNARVGGLTAYSRGAAIFVACSYVLQTLAAVALGRSLLHSEPTISSGVVLALLMVFVGTRFRGLNNIVHECSHFTFAERRPDNLVIGRLCASLVLGCFARYRADHMTHHAHLGDYEKDLDLRGIRAFRLEDPLTPKTVARHLLTPLVGLHFSSYLRLDLSERDGTVHQILKLAVIAAAIAFLVLEPATALLLLWFPFLWIYPAINYWTDCVDHAGLVSARDELLSSRNLAIPRPLQPLLFPRNDCYHLVHHLFPQVPARHLASLHRQLLSEPEYRARAGTGQPATEP